MTAKLPGDQIAPIYRLQMFLPAFPDYPVYSAPMTTRQIRAEKARLEGYPGTFIVQRIEPDVLCTQSVSLQDFF